MCRFTYTDPHKPLRKIKMATCNHQVDCPTKLQYLKPNIDTPLFATNSNPLQLYLSPRPKIFAFKHLTADLVILRSLGDVIHYTKHTDVLKNISSSINSWYQFEVPALWGLFVVWNKLILPVFPIATTLVIIWPLFDLCGKLAYLWQGFRKHVV